MNSIFFADQKNNNNNNAYIGGSKSQTSSIRRTFFSKNSLSQLYGFDIRIHPIHIMSSYNYLPWFFFGLRNYSCFSLLALRSYRSRDSFQFTYIYIRLVFNTLLICWIKAAVKLECPNLSVLFQILCHQL